MLVQTRSVHFQALSSGTASIRADKKYNVRRTTTSIGKGNACGYQAKRLLPAARSCRLSVVGKSGDAVSRNHNNAAASSGQRGVRSSTRLGALDLKEAETVEKTDEVTPATQAPIMLPPNQTIQVETSLCLSPKEGYQVMVDKGKANAGATVFKIFAASVLGGFYVAMGGMLSLAVAGNAPGVASQNPGFIKWIFAALFPVNLLMALLTGAQLYTGNTANMAASLYEKQTNMGHLAKAWVVSWVGNIIGCSTYAVAAYAVGALSGGAGALAITTTVAKCSMPFGVCVLKAIMCNWLVCMAVYLCGCAKDLTGKMVGIWWPIMTFVAIGFEHSVANMFILPAGLLAGAPLSVAEVFWNNLVPVTLGNGIAGAIFMAGGMSIMHGKLGEGK